MKHTRTYLTGDFSNGIKEVMEQLMLLTEQSYEQVQRSLPSKGEKSMSVIKSMKNKIIWNRVWFLNKDDDDHTQQCH